MRTRGFFVRRLITGGPLAAPWGLALAPTSFGEFGGDLLVGNFSFVAPAALTPSTRSPGCLRARSRLTLASVTPLAACGPSCLGRGAMEATPNTLYFTNGINGETNGLFGAINVVPRSHRRCRTARPDLGERWSSWLVATPSADRLKSAIAMRRRWPTGARHGANQSNPRR